MNPSNITPELHALAHLFYDSPEAIGRFEEVDATALPHVFKELLNHNEHMTVAVEAHHGCPVDVRVLAVRKDAKHYSRKILLARQSDGKVVQFGIVRLNLDLLEPDTRAEIESESKPLGRVLIEHGVLRKVRLLSLWKITSTGELPELLGAAEGGEYYGRTALIYCNGVPAVELLEVVVA